MTPDSKKRQFIDQIKPVLERQEPFRLRGLLKDNELLDNFRFVMERAISLDLILAHFDFTVDEIMTINDLVKGHDYLAPAFLTLLAPSIYANSLEHLLPQCIEIPTLDMATTIFGYSPRLEGNPDLLCDFAEDYLCTSIARGTACIVNEHFIFKRVGKSVLLALEDVKTSNGTFFARHWYYPLMPTEASISFPISPSNRIDSSMWTYVRPLSTSKYNVSPDETFQLAQAFASQKKSAV